MSPPTLHGKVPSELTGAVAGERWPGRRLPPWQTDLFAIVATAATLGLRLAIDGQLGGQLLLVIFTVPIMLSAYLGGLRAGLLATAISFFGASYYLLPPFHSFAVASSVERWQQFFVVLAGGFISILSEALHRARARAERATREQQEAEAGRQASESRFRAYFEEAADAMFIYDDTGRFLDVNPPACAGLGYTREELLAMSLFDIEAVFDLPRAQVVWSQMVPGQPFVLRGRHRRKDGSTFPVEVRLGCFDAEGRRCFFATTRDITERDRQEAATARALERLHEAQRIGKIGDWEFDLGTGAITWSPEVFVIIGRDPALGPPRSYEENAAAFEPASAALMAEKVAAVIATGTAQEYEVMALRPDGQRVVVQATAVPRTDKEGKVTGLYGTVQDITKRQQAEEAVRRLAAIVESSDDAIIGKNLENIVTSWNAGAERLFGYPAAEMVGASILRLFPPERHAEEAMILAQIVQGKTIRHFETVRVRKDGSLVDVAVTISAIRDATGEIVGASKLARDITEQKKAAEELRRSEASLANAQRIARLGNWDLDIATQSLFWSAEIYEIFGLSRAEFGTSYEAFLAAVHPEDRARVDAAQRAAVAGEARLDLEHRVVRPDGTERVVHELADLTCDATGRPIRLGGTVQDITERVQAAAKLRESERQFQTMLDAMAPLAWMAEADGSIYWYNQQWFDFTGTTPEQMKGWGWQQVHDPELLPRVLARWRAAIGSGEPFEMDFPLRAADGSYRWFLTRAVPLKDSRGVVVRWLGTNTDITTQREAAEEIANLNATLEQRVIERTEALRESEQRLAIAVQAAQAGVWAWDIKGERLEWSPEVFRLFGLNPTKEDVSLEIWRGLVHPEDRAGAERRMADALRHQTPLKNEYRVVLPTGELRWVSVLGATSYAENGEPVRMSGVCLDMTERKHGELELQKLAAELRVANQELEAYSTAVSNDLRVAEAADRIKSAFLATMSHELRTPLNSIIGFTGIVLLGKAGPLNAEQAKQLGMVRESAWHLLALINDVLDLSKIEAGQLNVSAASFDLRASIESVLGMVSPMAAKKALVLNSHVAVDLGTMVSDRRRIEQILLNLLSNAVKFTTQGGVTLTAELVADFRPAPEAEAGPAVRLRVADTGIGIRPEDLAQLFQPFHQIDTGLDREAEGTGLGLAISRRLAALLGGEIAAASRWSQGSEFTVILPLQNPSAP